MDKIEIFQGLDASSQKHEKELVVDFGIDRILNFLGIYFTILLAIVTKISEITGSKITCFATNVSSMPMISYAYVNTYCLESNTALTNGSFVINIENELMEDPDFVKAFIQWMPYGMLFQGFLFALPSAWWHFRVGARLLGHLKFMRLLIEDTYGNVKQISAGVYKRQPYDKTINAFFAKMNCDDRFIKKSRGRMNCVFSNAEEGHAEVNDNSKNETPTSKFLNLITGDMVDQHIFSALCVENLSSFLHYPYVTSIFELLRSQKFLLPDGALPLQSALYRQWCNEDNFKGRVVVLSYVIIQMMRIFLSSISLCVMVYLVTRLVESGWDSETFRCDVLYQNNVVFLCSISRKMEMTGFFIVNFLITAIFLFISVYRLMTFSRFRPDYFRSLHDDNTAAIVAAFLKTKQD